MFKTAAWMTAQGYGAEYVNQVSLLAHLELYVATAVVGYVALRYAAFYRPVSQLLHCLTPSRA